MSLHKRIKAYRREHDQVLLTGSVEQLRAFCRKHDLPCPSDPKVVEIGMHKQITASVTLPRDYRRQSKAWLTARGYMAWDDGDL